MFPTMCLLLTALSAKEQLPTLKLPSGFDLQVVAGDELATDIICLTIDAQGRILVSGRGYLRGLIVNEKSGLVERVIPFAHAPKDGAQGLLWEGDTIHFVGNGGVWRCRYREDGSALAPPERLLACKTGVEHDTHALRRGPDGSLFVLCGNMANILGQVAVDEGLCPRPIAGCLLRLRDGERPQVIAHGLRNAYDFDFTLDGEVITFDSDNERCIGLPWYEPTRLYHLYPGSNCGWLSPQFAETFRLPSYLPDINRPIVTLGRGSPTGVACYRGTHYPPKYQGGVFVGDWTFGRIHFVGLTPDAGSYRGQAETFAEVRGESGFAITALVEHPRTGELFVSVGGRGTRGGIYRISYRDPNEPNRKPTPRREPKALFTLSSRRPAPPNLDRSAWPLLTAKSPEQVLIGARAVQLALGDLTSRNEFSTAFAGYTPRGATPAEPLPLLHLLDAASTTDPHARREVERCYALLGDDRPATRTRLSARLRTENDPCEDLHLLTVLARLPGPRTMEETRQTADALLGLGTKYRQANLSRDRHWPTRVREIVTALVQFDPRLPRMLADAPSFGSDADHVILAQAAGIEKAQAGRAFLRQAAANAEYAWSAAHVSFLAALPLRETRSTLHALAERGLTDAVLPILAAAPDVSDRPFFLRALTSIQPTTLATALTALEKLPAPPISAWGPVAVLLRRTPQTDGDRRLQGSALRLLNEWSGRTAETPAAWLTWFAAVHPTEAKQLQGGYDAEAWRARIAAIAWERGDAERGRLVFTKASCAACHNGTAAVGPDLTGVAKRFHRADLLTAILEPSKDVSPRYRSTQIETVEGKLYEGIVIYDSVDGLVLETGTSGTLQIPGSRIASRSVSLQSLMPAGLLDRLSNEEIADLFAYLNSLTGSPRDR